MPDGCSLELLNEIHLKVVEASPDAKIVIDGEGVVVVFNAQAELLFGYHRDDVLGQKIEMLLPDTTRNDHSKWRDLYFEDPKTREMGAEGRTLEGCHHNGDKFLVQIKLAPILVRRGGLYALAVVRKVKPPGHQHPLETRE